MTELRLRDHQPRRMLRVEEHRDPPVRFPTIDAHNHLGGGWASRDADELAAALNDAGFEGLVDLDGGWGDQLRLEIERWQVPLPGRIAVFAGLDYGAWSREAAFGEFEAGRLRSSVAAGARGLKVWKTLGLHARDRRGRLVAVDDERLDPLWATAAELGIPVTIHVADPIAFFEPLDAFSERLEELLEHPDWHVWPTRPADLPDAPGFPRFDELIDALESVLVRHPGTVFIGAHVGCAAEDLRRVSAMLERCSNYHVDIAARIAELGRQPYSARAFIVRWADRVLFGTDAPPDPGVAAIHRRFLETFDESFDYDTDGPPSQGRWQIHGLGLPDDVLRVVYAGNARRLIRFA
jgi:predicted TIM-barrel fold metal-dependent hydrolase